MKLQQRGRGVFRSVVLNEVASQCRDLANWSSKILDQVIKMRRHVDQRPTAILWVLPPRARDLGIPAGELYPYVDDASQLSLLDQLLDCGMSTVELHHVAFLEENASLPAKGYSFSSLAQITCQRFFAQDM